jgi:hypothetical protein
MKQTINLSVPAVSINAAYYNNKKFGYRSEVKEWIGAVCWELSQNDNKESLRQLREYFDESKHCFKVSITFFTPKFFNKAGSISAHSMDVGNASKIILDVLFTEPFFGNNSVGKCENICHDDRFITELITIKQPRPEYGHQIEIEILDLPKC